MGIYRSTNPLDWGEIDGISIAETAPPPSVQGVAANIALLVGQFQRGPSEVYEPSNTQDFLEIYGRSSFDGNTSLKNKKFGRLKIARVIATDAAKSSNTFDDGSTTDIITFTAKYKGAYGDNITVKIEDGTVASTKTYTITDDNTDSVVQPEVYANIAIAEVDSDTFASSKLVDVTVESTASEPANAAATNLSGGSDGTVADTDYETAIGLLEEEEIGNVVFLDSYNATRAGYLKTHTANTKDKMVIVAGAEGDSRATAVTDAGNYRDTAGRIIYAYPWVKTTIDGSATYTSPASWLASVISQTPPHVDPAAARTRDFLVGATGLKLNLGRTDYVALNKAGIATFEMRKGQMKLKNGVVTQISNSSKLTILRRRMADWLTASAANFFENFQNEPNRETDRNLMAAQLLAWVEGRERAGILPKDSEVKTGNAKKIDPDVLNTDASVAAGYNKILWKQRIYSSQRFIVLQAEIGESVVVTESE